MPTMSDAPLATAVSADEELRFLIQRLARRIRTHRTDDTVSDSQLSVLFHLSHASSLAPSELAALERISPPSMNRTLNCLEDLGLVRREPSVGDARRVDVTLTSAGHELLEATRRVRTEWFGERLAELDPAERRALTAAIPALQKLVDA